MLNCLLQHHCPMRLRLGARWTLKQVQGDRQCFRGVINFINFDNFGPRTPQKCAIPDGRGRKPNQTV
jgi:hypothetical protein